MADPQRAVVFEDSKSPLNPAQQSVYSQRLQSGEFDPVAPAGSAKRPYALRAAEEARALKAEDFSVDFHGNVRQGPYEAEGLPPVQPVDDTAGAYAKRLEGREAAFLDAQSDEVHGEALAYAAREAAGDDTGKIDFNPAVFQDIAKGTLLEGPPAVVRGVKEAVNSVIGLTEWAADFVPAPTLIFPNNGAPNSPDHFELRFMSGKEAKKQGLVERFLPRLGTPKEGEPETVTGKFIEKGSEFVAGMLGAGKLTKGAEAFAWVGRTGKAMMDGAISDFAAFGPHEARMSDTLAQIAPEHAKPIFEWLSSDANDGELEGRAKNAIEGLGLGMTAEGLFRGIKSIRAVRQLKKAADAKASAEGFQVPPSTPPVELTAIAEKTVADAKALLKTGPKPDKGTIKPKDLPGKPENVFDLKLDRIEAPEDVQKTIATLADRHAKGLETARRGTVPWAQTKAEAEGFDWIASMATRRPGQALNASETYAYRTALNASATRVLELAEHVKANPNVAAQYAFRKSVATHSAIQAEFMGARAEAGRALNAWKIPADAPENALRQIDYLLKDSGGADAVSELAAKVLKAAKNGDKALNEVLRMTWQAKTKEAVKLLYTNGLLSGFGTPIVNFLGNTSAMGLNVLSRSVAPRLGQALGGTSDVVVGEAAALVHGYTEAFKDAFKLAPKETLSRISFDSLKEKGMLRGLAPGLDDALPEGIQRGTREESRAARGFGAATWDVPEDSTYGRFLDVMQMVFEGPANFNQLGDDFFKTLAARGELHAQAFRTATREGIADPAAFRARVAEITDNPTADMLETAEREMQELTFTRRATGVAEKLGELKQAMDSGPVPIPFGTLMMPFIRTPANIMSMAMRHSPLAPFVSKRFAEDIAEGGARAEIANAKLAVGAGMYAVFMDMAINGDLTGGGPNNPSQRDAMQREDERGGVIWQPYSVRVHTPGGNERWVSFDRLDPLGTIMSLVGDLNELVNNQDWDGSRVEEIDEIGANILASMGEAFFDKTMLRSTTETLAAMSSGDEVQVDRMLKNRTSGMIPFSGLSRMFRRGADEYMRETASATDALKNTIPGLSKDLPPQRDLWGKPRTYQSGLGMVYDAMTPVRTKRGGGSAIDLEILDNGVSVQMPTRSISIEGETVSLKNRPDIYSEFVRLSGEPAFEHLQSVVTGNHADSDFYLSLTDGPSGGKAEYIKDVISAYRRDAKAQIAETYGEELSRMAADSVRRREEARSGE